MADLMHEIDDELRREKLAAFWKENALWIIGGIVFAVILTGALTFWRGHQAQKDMLATQQLLAAVQADNEAALDALAAEGKDTHSAFAALISAGMHARAGETEKALALYDQVAAMRGLDSTYRDLAALLAAGHRLDSADPAALHKTLKPLTEKGNIWRFSALELQALLFAREGRMEEAVRALTDISTNAQAPADLRIRATTLREIYLGAPAGGAAAADE